MLGLRNLIDQCLRLHVFGGACTYVLLGVSPDPILLDMGLFQKFVKWTRLDPFPM